MKKLATPDFTPAQILAAIAAIVAQAVSYSLLAAGTGQLIVSIAGIVVPVAFIVGDAIIRHGRVQISVAEISADVQRLVALLDHHAAANEVAGANLEATKTTAAAAIAQAKAASQ